MARNNNHQSEIPSKKYILTHEALAKQYGLTERYGKEVGEEIAANLLGTSNTGIKEQTDQREVTYAKNVEELVTIVDRIKTYWALMPAMNPDLPGVLFNEVVYRINFFRESDGDIPHAPVNWQDAANWVVDTKRYLKNKTRVCNHFDNYTFVTWFDKSYTFNKTQAKAIKLLWQAWKDKAVGVHENDIAKVVDTSSDQYRLIHTFRQHGKYHSAWRTMIHSLGNHMYCLKEPKL